MPIRRRSDSNRRLHEHRRPEIPQPINHGVGLPGPDTGEPSLIGALAQLVWSPVLDHEEGR